VVAYPFTGYWNDIGTVRSFFDTNIMLAQPKPEFNLYDPAMPLYTNARMLPPAKITRTGSRTRSSRGERDRGQRDHRLGDRHPLFIARARGSTARC
jgi:hypothetical protein